MCACGRVLCVSGGGEEGSLSAPITGHGFQSALQRLVQLQYILIIVA